jgi:hypothetical protein
MVCILDDDEPADWYSAGSDFDFSSGRRDVALSRSDDATVVSIQTQSSRQRVGRTGPAWPKEFLEFRHRPGLANQISRL